MRRALSLLTAAGLLLALLPAVVGAHALYDHSDPPANAVLAASPLALRVWFAEKLDMGASGLTLYGPSGQAIRAGSPSMMADDASGLTWPMPQLDPGVYTVGWATRSADDGDDATGFYAFTIGQPSQVGAPLALPAQPAGDLRVALTVAPAAVGLPKLTATVRDTAGKPVAVQRVFVRFRPVSPDVGQGEVILTPTDPGTFATDLLVGLPGAWRFDVRVRRETADDVSTVFTVPFAAGISASVQPSATATAPVATATLVLATATVAGALATPASVPPPAPTPTPATPAAPSPTPVPATPTQPSSARLATDPRAIAGLVALIALIVVIARRRR